MLFHQPANSSSNYNYNANFYTDSIWEYHFHRNLELIYVINGSVDCTVNDVNYCVKAGEFGLCLPCDIHRYQPENNTLYWVLVFSEDFVRYFSKEIANKVGDGFVFSIKPAIKEYVVSQLVNNPNPTVYTLKSCLYAICEEYKASVPLMDKNRKHEGTLLSIIDFIAENHTRRITLADIAKKFDYDYNYMSRCFKKYFNVTFTDFINSYRLETAINLLENTDHTITSIAFESGFQSLRTFNDFFKKTMKLSPTEYRKHGSKS